MSGNKVLIDSNVIIFASKQGLDVERLLSSYDSFYASIVSYMEVYGYEFTNLEEKAMIDALFGALEVVSINKEIADQVIVYRKNAPKKIKLPDAMLLATARYLGAALLTDDWDDFEGIDPLVPIHKLDQFKM
jgi:hypothetical protein